MKNIVNKLICLLLIAAAAASCSSEGSCTDDAVSLDLKSYYVETMDRSGLTRNIVADYGMVSDAVMDQSAKMQLAIDDIAAHGGGNLIIPNGAYCFTGVYMRSNVHILVDKNVVLKPYISSKRESFVLFNFTKEGKEDGGYIENCSIRGLNGKYKVDYSMLNHDYSSRFIIARMVKNFHISDADIIDNHTVHCAIIYVPSGEKGAEKWEISRPTNGETINCSIHLADSGYGMCQLHGAERLYFENIYANGGVALRLESGAGGIHAGLYDIQARNISSEGGRGAVMMSPHTTHNGTIRIDGVYSKNTGAAVMLHGGFIDRKHTLDPTATVGSFADNSVIVNVHAVYGEDAQIDDKEVCIKEPVEGWQDQYYENGHGNLKSYMGPSYAPVYEGTHGHYSLNISNITAEGFPAGTPMIVHEEDIMDRIKRRWEIVGELTIVKNRDPEWIKYRSHQSIVQVNEEIRAQQIEYAKQNREALRATAAARR